MRRELARATIDRRRLVAKLRSDAAAADARIAAVRQEAHLLCTQALQRVGCVREEQGTAVAEARAAAKAATDELATLRQRLEQEVAAAKQQREADAATIAGLQKEVQVRPS